MVRSDRLLALVFIAFGLVFYLQTYRFAGDEAAGPNSPTFLPRLIIWALVGCCLIQLFRSQGEKVSFPAPVPVLLGAGLVAGYALGLAPVGYFLVTPAFLFLFPLLLGYREYPWLAAYALGGVLVALVVFYWVLGVPLPLGLLER